MNSLDLQMQSIFLQLLLNRTETQGLGDCLSLLLQTMIEKIHHNGVCKVELLLCLQQHWQKLDSDGQLVVGPHLSGEIDQAHITADHQLFYQIDFPLASGSFGWLRFYREAQQVPVPKTQELRDWSDLIHKTCQFLWAQELQERYVALMDASVDAIITIAQDGTVIQFSRGAEKLFGYSSVEVVGRTVNMLMPLPYAQEHDGYMERYMRTGEAKIIGIGRRVPARRKDGSIFPAHLAVSEYQRHGVRYFVGILTDISEFVEARSRAIVEERRHLSRELHDSVSQALFGIVLGAQAVKNSLEPVSQAHEGIDYVLSLAESGLAEMRTLIFELRPESLESQGLLACLAMQSSALARRYQIEIELAGDKREPDMALAFKHEIYRIVMESLHNVVKHARADKCKVTFEYSPGYCAVTVSDNGQGFLVDKVSPHKVGLRSMRERVAQLGGQIRIESEPGQGSQVIGVFPTSFQGVPSR